MSLREKQRPRDAHRIMRRLIAAAESLAGSDINPPSAVMIAANDRRCEGIVPRTDGTLTDC